MNKKGFTAIEMMFSLAFGAFVILAVIGIPNMLFSQIKDYRIMEAQQSSVQNIIIAVKKDLHEAKGRVRYDGEYLIMKNVAYSFKEDGVYREISGEPLRISKIPMRLDYYADAFTLSTMNPEAAEYVQLNFNKRYSSFDDGGTE